MKKVDQTVFTVPGGNCFSACVASLLELNVDDVPYFMGDKPAGEPCEWFDDFLDWLRGYGLWAIPLPVGNGWKPEGLCILSGKSPRGDFDHSVVANGLSIVHDPHPSRAGILSHVDAIVLVPLDPKAMATGGISEAAHRKPSSLVHVAMAREMVEAERARCAEICAEVRRTALRQTTGDMAHANGIAVGAGYCERLIRGQNG